MGPVLQVDHLSVLYEGSGLPVPALRDVTFNISRVEIVGILGESGAGKTTLAAALLQLLAPAARIVSGSVRFMGDDLTRLKEKELEKIRGAELSLVFQEPAISLSPVMRAGTQIANVIRAHRDWNRAQCRDLAEKLMKEVGLADTGRMYDAYPHELSSGEKQRVAIAQAVACEPAIIVADEPTANLDYTTKTQVLDLFKALKARLNVGLLFITHDPKLLAGFAERIMVMYAGQIVEQGLTGDILEHALHPYTIGLLRCIPEDQPSGSSKESFSPIPGDPPDLTRLPGGCAFEPRCGARLEICKSCVPDVSQPVAGRSIRCFNPGVVP